MLFSQIDLRMIEEFRRFMLTVPQGGGKSGIVSQNTAAPPISPFLRQT